MHSLKRLLKLVLAEDHKRGCQGRSYVCSCGYEAAVIDQAEVVQKRDLSAIAQAAHDALQEVFADNGKVNSPAWMDKAGAVLSRLKSELK